MNSALVKITKTYVVCPHCGENSGGSIDHLIAEGIQCAWGTWYCDSCGKGFRGVIAPDGTVAVERTADSFTKCFDLLRIPPQEHPIYIVRSTSHPTGREREGTKYYYESHSCPTNWLTDIEMVSIEGDQDPHGLIEYVADAAFDQAIVDDCNHDWSETFPVISGNPSPPAVDCPQK